MGEWFNKAANKTARLMGSPSAFLVAILVVIAWAVSGPMFNYSDTWQLIINTGTTVATFLMVFLIQNAQNRDSDAIQMKLDELVRSVDGAHNEIAGAENMPVAEQKKLVSQIAEAVDEECGDD